MKVALACVLGLGLCPVSWSTGSLAAQRGVSPLRHPDPGEMCDPDEGPPLTASDSPRGAVLRLLRAYCQRNLEAYVGLLTEDFRFETRDPDLRALIPEGFSREDESIAARNLFLGHLREDGTSEPAVREIRIRAGRLVVMDDPTERDVLSRYRLVVVDSVRLEVKIESGTWLIVHNGRDAFHVVRGDMALCAEGQKRDADHWYVRRWIEVPEAGIAPPTARALSSRQGRP